MAKINIPEDLVMKYSDYWNRTKSLVNLLHMYGTLVGRVAYKPVQKK